MIVALAVPFLIIILVLIKIYHTVSSSRDPFVKRGGMVFTSDLYMQDFDEGVPVEKAIYAVVRVRKETAILDVIKKRTEEHKENKKYSWLAIAVKDATGKNWLVTFREKAVLPKMVCQSQVNVESGATSAIECSLLKKK